MRANTLYVFEGTEKVERRRSMRIQGGTEYKRAEGGETFGDVLI